MTMTRNWKKGVWKRRSNILYKLRKKGVRVNTRSVPSSSLTAKIQTRRFKLAAYGKNIILTFNLR